MSVFSRAVHFLEGIVEPDHKEAFQNPESLRHAFHFCISLLSLRDWVFVEFSGQPGWTFGRDMRAFQAYLESQCPEFKLVCDMGNAAKHQKLKEGRMIGGADHIAVWGSAAISGTAISSMPTLEVVADGKVVSLLYTAEQVIQMWRRLFATNGWD